MTMDEEKKLRPMPWPGKLAEIVKLTAEHGIPRVLVAGGIAILISFLVGVPSKDWQINIALLIVSLSIIVIGALIRIFEMVRRFQWQDCPIALSQLRRGHDCRCCGVRQ